VGVARQRPVVDRRARWSPPRRHPSASPHRVMTSIPKSLVPAVAALAVVLLLLAGWAGLSAARELASADAQVQHTREVELALERLLSGMRDAETGQRGFLIVGDERYLEPYTQALPLVTASLQRVSQLTVDNPQQQALLPTLREVIEGRLALLDEGIQLRRQSERGGLDIVTGGRGKQLMDRIRDIVARMQAVEATLLAARQADVVRAHRLQNLAYLTTVLVAIGLIAAMVYVARREARQVRRSEARLAVIFSSIGDAVIATDGQGAVERMNGVAEQLTGWPLDQARGQPLDTIFNIVNEDTRQTVESPVGKVIRVGGIVGLANHTLLIARDGSERPIEDSAAPIGTDPRGSGGIVLVFRDATATRDLERARLQSERRFRDIADAMPQIVYVCNQAGAVEYVNRRWYEYTGQDVSSALDFDRFIHPDDRAPLARAWRQALEQQAPLETQFRLCNAAGVTRWFLTRAVPLRDLDSQAVSWYGTSTDIDELVLARQSLDAADRNKDEFLATLAHELRNPLAPIRNAAQLLRNDVAEAAMRVWASDVIERQVRTMGALLDDLLEVSRISRGTLVLQPQWVALTSVLDAAIEQTRPVIDSRRHELTVHLDDLNLSLEADPLRLTQIVGNLLNNAAKYTDPGGRIDVRVARRGDTVLIEVRDTGIGLSHDDLERVFDMFTQVSAGGEHASGGVGIGLALVKGLVELHHGTVSAHSDGPGRGCTFRVVLPQGRPRQDTGDALPADDGAADARRLRVLVADDNRDGALTMQGLLQSAGHTVEVAFDGESAVTLASRFKPDVALLDLGMPRLDGYAVARRLRDAADGQPVLLLAITGWGQADDRQRAIDAGFDEHLVKPVDPALVLQRLAARAQLSGP
jgi:PAS domain S-box-containing protein